MNKNNKLDKNFNKLNEKNQEKYIEEMHKMADKTAKKNNLIFGAVVVPILIVCILVVKQMVSFSFNLAKNDSTIKNNTTEVTKTAKEDNKQTDEKIKNNEIPLNEKIAEYIQNKNNRQNTFKQSISINKGSKKGASVIFISQLYRNNGYDIPKNTISTKGLLQALKGKNWTKETDCKKLKKGDICFTTLDNAGSPSHAYIFMGWVKEGKTDYAYVCDGQTSDYNDTLHKRNLSVATPKKDKMAFFMKAPNKK